jgi:hypothetical protein
VASSSAAPVPLDDVVVRDIVINARPDQPPLAVLVYFEMLKQQYKVTGRVRSCGGILFATGLKEPGPSIL